MSSCVHTDTRRGGRRGREEGSKKEERRGRGKEKAGGQRGRGGRGGGGEERKEGKEKEQEKQGVQTTEAQAEQTAGKARPFSDGQNCGTGVFEHAPCRVGLRECDAGMMGPTKFV